MVIFQLHYIFFKLFVQLLTNVKYNDTIAPQSFSSV